MKRHQNFVSAPTQVASNHACKEKLSFEVFKQYAVCKGCDVISESRFKKHMMHCREIGDTWAVHAQQCISEVLAHVRQLSERIRDLETLPNPPLKTICDAVICMPLPPNTQETYSGICSISKVQSRNNIVIQRKKQDANRILVNAHFAHFFTLLWFAIKIDYVMRNYTRFWLDEQEDTLDIEQLCHQFETQNDDMFEKFRTTFNCAVQHVNASVDVHLAEGMSMQGAQ